MLPRGVADSYYEMRTRQNIAALGRGTEGEIIAQ